MRFWKWMILWLLLAPCSAQAMRVMFDVRTFFIPGQGPMVEAVTSFDGRTFQLAAADSGFFQSTAQVTIAILYNDSIIDFKKSSVLGPLVAVNSPADFMSVERFVIPNGHYTIEIEIEDMVSHEVARFNQPLEVAIPQLGVCFSEIEFISAYRRAIEVTPFTKFGYDFMPYVSNYFSDGFNNMMLYAETYRTDSAFGEGNAVVLNAYIADLKGVEVIGTRQIKRIKTGQVVPNFLTMDLRPVPSGEYEVVLELRDAQDVIQTVRKRFFTRYKSSLQQPMAQTTDSEVAGSFAAAFTDSLALLDLIRYHLPIAEDVDRGIIDRQMPYADLRAMQSFLYTFWKKRDMLDPAAAFHVYEENINIVRENFSTKIKPGWQTDRGRVYLQYGKPNVRTIRLNDADYWPFEIWHYYVTDDNLHNRRFLFYDTNLMGDMELLHSDVPGEVKNFAWKDMVRSRPAAMNMSDLSRNNANQRTDPNSRDEIENLWFTPH